MESKLQHYRQIDIIRQAEKTYLSNTGIAPHDISHWNSGNNYKKILKQSLYFPKFNEFMDYIYSFSFNPKLKDRIIANHNTVNSKCVIFNSATSAISTICSLLKFMKFKKICLIQPSYFSVFEQMESLGLEFYCVNYLYDGQYHIPYESIDKDTEIIWITQPVFSTGTYLSDSELQKLLDSPYYVICDGSMCDVVNNIPHFTIDCSKSMFIFSPQKTIGLNGIKFSYVLCDEEIAYKLEDLQDIVSGGLSISNVIAVNHYLSENYYRCLKLHNMYVKESHKRMDVIISNSNKQIIKCGNSIDNTYETLMLNKIPFMEQVSFDFMYEFINKTGVSITPGCVNGFDHQNGFCFRINHTLDISLNCIALNRIISHLSYL